MSLVSSISNSVTDAVSGTMNVVEAFLANKYVATTLVVIFILYGSLIAPRLSPSVTVYLKNDYFRLLCFFTIAFLAYHNTKVAIVATAVVVFTFFILERNNLVENMVGVKKYREQFDSVNPNVPAQSLNDAKLLLPALGDVLKLKLEIGRINADEVKMVSDKINDLNDKIKAGAQLDIDAEITNIMLVIESLGNDRQIMPKQFVKSDTLTDEVKNDVMNQMNELNSLRLYKMKLNAMNVDQNAVLVKSVNDLLANNNDCRNELEAILVALEAMKPMPIPMAQPMAQDNNVGAPLTPNPPQVPLPATPMQPPITPKEAPVSSAAPAAAAPSADTQVPPNQQQSATPVGTGVAVQAQPQIVKGPDNQPVIADNGKVAVAQPQAAEKPSGEPALDKNGNPIVVEPKAAVHAETGEVAKDQNGNVIVGPPEIVVDQNKEPVMDNQGNYVVKHCRVIVVPDGIFVVKNRGLNPRKHRQLEAAFKGKENKFPPIDRKFDANMVCGVINDENQPLLGDPCINGYDGGDFAQF